MPRRYDAHYSAAVTASGELLQITGPSDAVTRITSVRLTQSTDYGDAAAEGLRVSLNRSASAGSGGGTVTPTAKETGDAAYGGTVLSANSTPAGSLTVLVEEAFNIQAGYFWQPTEKNELYVSPSGVFVIRLETSPADSITFDLQVEFEEIGG